ncbi:hypothetical protein ACFVY1_05025 [Streptomyces sp. NPDC058293]|uniref:Amidase n=1 Tax=Streptomyces sp. NBC_00119 TaxID=2975659 RepID=A0AAU1UBV4_9ACTN|nr:MULTISPECIES: hypothetical protein [unclassified Streptomyces]MCX4645605.1 hypothetical protein [Streptomyces sp. NBC_01446]MCX5318231.1 hypothetical protein [Streptomyces sp. NBC_00120]
MDSTPIVVHPPTPTGGRRVAIQGHVAGIARSDADLVAFLCQAGVTVHSALLDDEAWVKWRGGRAHHYAAL